jgi:inhibitor of KinA
MTISPLGDSAIIVDFADEGSDLDRLLARALAGAQALERAKIRGVVDITNAYQSVAVFFDLSRIERDMSIEEKVYATIGSTSRGRSSRRRVVEIPVCYDQEFALDLIRVASQTSLTPDAIAALHCSAEYTVACIGFVPGFPFLAGLSEKLRVPRLATPRTKVPPGSVAIANAQAGIYPFESPGGWNVIGRTPVPLFKVNENPPTFLRSGDRVRFRRINREEFEANRK